MTLPQPPPRAAPPRRSPNVCARHGAGPHLAGAAVLTLAPTVVDVCGQRRGSRLGPPLPQPCPPAARPPVLTDVAVGALPARDAITVIATNQVFARKSIKARLPFALIGVCERDKGSDGARAPPAPAPAAAAHAQCTAHAHTRPAGPLPSWQVAPPHCSGQMHSKPSTWSTQVPPAAHGLEVHSSMSAQGQRERCGVGRRDTGLALPVTPPLTTATHVDAATPPPPSRPLRCQAECPRRTRVGTHQAHRWARSSRMGSGTRSLRAPRGKSPRWHTGSRRRHARLC